MTGFSNTELNDKNFFQLETAIEDLYKYLYDVMYNPQAAFLDIQKLPDNLKVFCTGFQYFVDCVMETKILAQSLANGDLNGKIPSRGNEIAAPLKALHASLRHLTWQIQQVAKGDYTQRVAFMREFSEAFNLMVEQLAERQKILECKINQMQINELSLEKHAYRDSITQLYNRTFGMLTLDRWLYDRKCFSLIFADLDGLKYINDEFGHGEGDIYIMNSAKHLKTFSPSAVVCRIGGDEFMLLVPDISHDEAQAVMDKIYENCSNDEYLSDKTYFYSLSFGIVEVDAANNQSAGDILSIADSRM
jgi:diguanylate cyclase (GGDEF)-like protein